MEDAFILAVPTACASWTIAETELFRDLREGLKRWACRRERHKWLCAKLAYLPQCSYCSSHYVALAFLLLWPRVPVGEGWQGFILSWFSVVGVSAVYTTLYNLLRVWLRGARTRADYNRCRAERETKRVRLPIDVTTLADAIGPSHYLD